MKKEIKEESICQKNNQLYLNLAIKNGKSRQINLYVQNAARKWLMVHCQDFGMILSGSLLRVWVIVHTASIVFYQDIILPLKLLKLDN